MTPRIRAVLVPLLALLPVAPAAGQEPGQRIPPEPVHPPASFQRALAAGTRTADGRPGEAYWQQRVDYRIDAELAPGAGVLRGRETITYRAGRRSPTTTAPRTPSTSSSSASSRTSTPRAPGETGG